MACLDTSFLLDAAGRGGRQLRARAREKLAALVEAGDDSSARVFGRIMAFLHAHGSPRGDMDVLIASVALVHGEQVVTGNVRHFAGIPDLKVETY